MNLTNEQKGLLSSLLESMENDKLSDMKVYEAAKDAQPLFEELGGEPLNVFNETVREMTESLSAKDRAIAGIQSMLSQSEDSSPQSEEV